MRSRRRRKKNIVPIIGTAIFVLVIICLFAGYFIHRRYSYGTKRADLNSYFSETSKDEYPIILGNERTGTYARDIEGVFYLSIDDVHSYISKRFYYGKEDNLFIFTTPSSIITNTVGSNIYTSTTDGEFTEAYPITRLEGETLYVALEYVAKFFNVSYSVYTDPNRISMYVGTVSEQTATLKKDTKLRIRGGVKSEILTDLKKGSRVVIIEDLDDWMEVRTEDGFVGYVESRMLAAKESFSYGSSTVEEPVYTSISRPHQIVMGWHAVYGNSGLDYLEEVTANTKGLNTISPTWITLIDNQGGIENVGDAAYVAKAHAMGLEVWAMVSDHEHESVDSKEILSHAVSRKTLIDNLISEAKRLGLDGINIDFEDIPSEAGRDFIEFIRELSIDCRREQIVLSIDNYVPYGFNDYYDRTEQGIVADYVVIMGYDEHYAGSSEAGSVASIGYVTYGIEGTTAQVPSSKVINALPFYTRIWTVSSSGISSRAVGMKLAKDEAASSGIEWTWNNETAQYYGDIANSDGSVTKIWLEDAESIAAKLAVMKANNLAGVAAWRLGFETPDIWDVIYKYIQ